MKLAQRQQGEGSSKRRLGGTGRVEALSRKPAEHVESDGEVSSMSMAMSESPRSYDSDAELYRGKSDGEILARYEF
ncbi:MAG TPA: hypothetical protein VGG33_04935 [Polyangia bacterium]